MKTFQEFILEYEIDHDGKGNYRDDEGNTWRGGSGRSSFARRHTITSREPDHPHAVHINGKKWKTFGSRSHATNVANKIKGATVHKEEVQLDEISQATKDSYAAKAKSEVDQLKSHVKGEYGGIVKRMIARRKKGIKLAQKKTNS